MRCGMSSSGALISAQPGPRDPVNNLASLRLDAPVSVTVPEPARSATIGALVLALGADFDGSPTVRLTTIHGFPRTAGAGAAGTSPGLAGVPAARAGFVVSIAATAGVATAKAKGSLLDSFAGLPFAAATAGIGLGSIAGLDDSACPDDITAAASVADVAVVARLSSHPRS